MNKIVIIKQNKKYVKKIDKISKVYNNSYALVRLSNFTHILENNLSYKNIPNI